jgi:large subunit ribosomal protein L10
MITRQKKEGIVRKLTDAAKDSESMVFVNFHGLSVEDTNAMRSALREKEVGYTVARKTLIRRALEGGAEGAMPELPGEVAVAYGADPIAPASAVAEFAKKHKDNLAIIGGIFQGVFKDRSEMETIASIPPVETLRGMFVNVINSPIAGLAVALHAIAEKKSA